MHSTIMRRPLLAFALAALTATAACGDSTGPDEEDEPEIAAVLVTSGNTSTTVPLNGAQSGTLSLRANQGNVLTFTVLGANGLAEPVIGAHASEYEIRLVQGGTTRFTSTSTTHPYTGTFTAGAAGTQSYELQVYSKEHGHVEFTRPLSVTIVP